MYQSPDGLGANVPTDNAIQSPQDGQIKQSNFHDYNVLRITQMPEIEVYIVSSDQPPTGVGEQGTTPIAPAVVNALFNATGKRIKRFPLAKSGLKLV